MPGALILITAEVGAMENVHERVKDLDGVKDSEMLTGTYDVMAIAKAEKMSEITNTLVEDIRSIDGVKETVTSIFIE